MENLGENLTQEWAEEPFAPELWDSLVLAKNGNRVGLEELKKLAKAGSGLGKMYLGSAYWSGQFGLDRDEKLAELYFRESAQCGSIEGRFMLAKILDYQGRFDESEMEYKNLAQKSFSPAMFSLGCNHISGRISPKNIDLALLYFNEAASLGHMISKLWISYIKIHESRNIIDKMSGFYLKTKIFFPLIYHKINNPDSDRFRT